jgi:hypothetical protein
MNIEMSYKPLIKSWLNVRRHLARAAAAVRAVARRAAEPVCRCDSKVTRDASIRKEQYHAQSVAQLQQYRFFR